MSEDKESSTGKKINEVRKKISLCEGKRRAFFHTGIFFYRTGSSACTKMIPLFSSSNQNLLGDHFPKNILKISICLKFDNVNMGLIMLQNEPRVLYFLIEIDTILCSWKGEESK